MHQLWTRVDNKQLLLASVLVVVVIVAQFLAWPHPSGSWMNRTGIALDVGVVLSVTVWRWRRKS